MGVVGGAFAGAAQEHVRTAEAKTAEVAQAVDNAKRGTTATAQTYRDIDARNAHDLTAAGDGDHTPPPKTGDPATTTPSSAPPASGHTTTPPRTGDPSTTTPSSAPPPSSGPTSPPPSGGGAAPPGGGGPPGGPPGGGGGGGGGGGNPPGGGHPPRPTAPPSAADIRHSDASRQHILEGDGGRQGGHRAGTGFSKKTEFPKTWDDQKIIDAAHEVTQQGPPSKGPYLTKDANGNPAWAYDHTGTVDGVTVKTTVLADGEIRTAFPPNGADPGVITNPPAPSPAPQGVPMSNPPRYSHPDVGGDGSWTWEGPKGNKIIRVVMDDQGNVTKTELGDYKKK
jgi:hypothetical protein